MRLTIGLSSCFFHADPRRPIFKGKTLQYAEKSMVDYLHRHDTIVTLIPLTDDLERYVEHCDGLVLQGGDDVSPKSYGEEPISEKWPGDFKRDRYEIDLVQSFDREKKPIFGICRGVQIMNVAFGGSLYQDIKTQKPDALTHRDWQVYDQLKHEMVIEEGSRLSQMYPGQSQVRINSIHHQGIKDLAEELQVEALCPRDGIVEAVCHRSRDFVFGVQWHPEFQTDADADLLDPKPMLKAFIAACEKRKGV